MRDNNFSIKRFTKRFWIIFASVFIIQLIFILSSKIYFQIGYPLDDSWIHQTYARNLFLYNDWVFTPGIKSAGSTAPLWNLLLVPGHLLQKIFFLIWTFLISGILMSFTCVLFQKLFDKLSNSFERVPWAGLILVFEWHLMWATNSGMETILFITLIQLFFFSLVGKPAQIRWLPGLIVGLILFVRPDGITLFGPLIVVLVYYLSIGKTKSPDLIMNLVIIFVFMILYGIFNLRLSGEFLPNTFYAKQAEYDILFSQPILARYVKLLLIPITGASFLLIPGFIYFLFKKLHKFDIFVISLYMWFAGYILIYAIRLPVSYQHGRYIIPTIPVFLLLSLLGTQEIFKKKFKLKSQVIFGLKSAFISLLIVFLYLGGKAYIQDVAIINSEMVTTALWIDQNLEKEAVIAAHDIGALGFYANRQIIDLAGLVNPEVIPFIRDEQMLDRYLFEEDVDYLVIFPDWYEHLGKTKKEVYSSGGVFSPMLGGSNMKIYIWE
jgi:hypothetical protein